MRELDVRKATHFANIPDDWKVVPLLHATKYATGFTPPSGNESYYGDDYPWANISDLDGRRVLSETQRGLSLHAINKFPDERPAPKGSLLFSFKLSLGNVAIAGRNLYTNEAIAAFVPGKELNINYAYYCFPVFLPLYSQTNIYGAELLGGSRFERTKIPLPPLHEQHRIAQYLDRETAEIDAAVADLEKYVELMKKRKLARIESVLSDMEYRMCPVGVLADVTLGKMVSPKAPEAGGVERQYLRAAHVQPGGRLDLAVTEKKMWFSESELQRLDLLAGDVVVVEGGAGFGRSAYLESDLEEWGFQNSINRVRVNPSQADGRFVHLMLNRALLNGSIGVSVDTATLPHFTAEKLARFRIPICEIHKQKEVSQKIHEDTLTTNSLIAESNKLRNLLLKRRSVLITEAVTGRKQV
ncbi:restriction endonuclease subunit S [Corynebacterium testudinoris]|uniref:Restriction endonuclease S subunit n=1 Tax=Corynebacterium testudinoris TaxID=136857 RepID=A0A0G3HA62_9CORY|nr:restriction endonuclease subunit S [Corynebacterium testudinoris]AKK08788.1 restriction endonuclease S subunit [Corynebacterium testudinoris]